MSHDGNGNVLPGDSEQPAKEIEEKNSALTSGLRPQFATFLFPQEPLRIEMLQAN